MLLPATVQIVVVDEVNAETAKPDVLVAEKKKSALPKVSAGTALKAMVCAAFAMGIFMLPVLGSHIPPPAWWADSAQ